MKLQTVQENRYDALQKWHEYRDWLKENPDGDKGTRALYNNMARLYYYVKLGKQIIDIRLAIARGGLNSTTGHLNLAVAQANTKMVWCTYYPAEGKVMYKGRNHGPLLNADVIVQFMGTWNHSSFYLRAPVPIIPPQHMPAKLSDRHYILWEVDKWEMAAPDDPVLLWRITKYVFMVLGHWNLTPIEKMVMESYIRI